MISFKINEVPVLFAQAFSKSDALEILDFISHANSNSAVFKETILFIDTPATPWMVNVVEQLNEEGYRVVFRDHHGVKGEALNVRDLEKQKATKKLEKLLGDDCLITYRDLHPACSSLVSVGEFKDALAIIADPDADGLTAAIKASGVYYPELDDDAALLDSEPAFQVKGSQISQLLAKGVATLPTYDPERPHEREETLQRLFSNWVLAVQGDEKARLTLSKGVESYDAAVRVALKLAEGAREILPGIYLVDVTDSVVFDIGTLSSTVESFPDTRITILKKDKGPIASQHGLQYSLIVSKNSQNDIDLREFAPPEINNDPASGVISNVSFLLHVSESIWIDYVYPKLEEKVSSKP